MLMTKEGLAEIAESLFEQAFNIPRGPRSRAYKDGVRAGIRSRLKVEKVPILYQEGTAESDAYFAGTREGASIGNDWIDELKDEEV